MLIYAINQDALVPTAFAVTFTSTDPYTYFPVKVSHMVDSSFIMPGTAMYTDLTSDPSCLLTLSLSKISPSPEASASLLFKRPPEGSGPGRHLSLGYHDWGSEEIWGYDSYRQVHDWAVTS